MTRKQLEGVVLFMVLFNDKRFSSEELNRRFGLNITDETSQEEAISMYLESRNIILDREV